MAYIQLSALGLQAVVRHGNTLSDEYWEHRPTPQLRLFHQWLEKQRHSERLVQAMTAVFMNEIAPSPRHSVTLSDLNEYADECEKPRRNRYKPNILLDRQMSLFDS